MTAQIIPGGPRVPAELVTDAGVNVELDSALIIPATRTIDFQGAGVSVAADAGVAVVTISGGGSGIAIDEGGTPVVTLATVINFSGSGVAVTDSGGGVAHVSIAGGGGGGTVFTNGTLNGDGSSGDPLGVNSASLNHTVTVAVDGTTVAGNGTSTALHTVDGGTGVSADGTTITGTGKTGAPLHTVDGGTGVSVDGTTITGTGKTGSALHTVDGGTGIAVDGTSITGTGKTGVPIHTVAGGTAIVPDGTSIAGTGVTGTPIHTIAGGTAVAVDGVTITGTGLTGSPLTASGGGAGGRTFLATLQTVGGDHIGQPVSISGAAPSFGITSVTKASAQSTIAAAECVGLMIANASGNVTVQYDGIVTLTTAQWDALVAGESGGLTIGATYYLNGAGQFSTGALASIGAFPSRVGIGLNATQMVLLLSPPPSNIASALVQSNALTSSKGFGALGHSGTGRYQLPLLATPPADGNCIVTVTPATNFSVAVSVSALVVAGVVDVLISTEPGGAGIDGDFNVIVVNNS